jgi:2',3'-cyclic-nucleotide 2'-phosphodiesterase/3'-nucleotidase
MPRYEIQPGETLSSISKKLGVSMSDLVEKNKIKNPNYIRAYDYLYY